MEVTEACMSHIIQQKMLDVVSTFFLDFPTTYMRRK